MDEDHEFVAGVDYGGYWAEVTLTAQLAATLIGKQAESIEEAVAQAAAIIKASTESVDNQVEASIASRAADSIAEEDLS